MYAYKCLNIQKCAHTANIQLAGKFNLKVALVEAMAKNAIDGTMKANVYEIVIILIADSKIVRYLKGDGMKIFRNKYHFCGINMQIEKPSGLRWYKRAIGIGIRQM